MPVSGVVLDGALLHGSHYGAPVDIELELHRSEGGEQFGSTVTVLASGRVTGSSDRFISCPLRPPTMLVPGVEYSLVARVWCATGTEFGCGGERVVTAPTGVMFIFKDVHCGVGDGAAGTSGRGGGVSGENLTTWAGGQFRGLLFRRVPMDTDEGEI